MEYGATSTVDATIASHIKGISVDKFTVETVQQPEYDVLHVVIDTSFSFTENTIVSSLSYSTEFTVMSTGDIVDSHTRTRHEWKGKPQNGFFKELEHHDCYLMLVTKVLPYAFEFYNNSLPPLIDDYDDDVEDDYYDEYDDDY